MASIQTKQWVVETATASYEGLKLKEAQLPELGDHDILVEMKSVSLNYRDVMISNVSTQACHSRASTHTKTGNIHDAFKTRRRARVSFIEQDTIKHLADKIQLRRRRRGPRDRISRPGLRPQRPRRNDFLPELHRRTL